MDLAQLDSMRRYVGFDAGSTARLRAAHPLVQPHFAAIVDDFYATIEAHAHARDVITGGTAQIERLKRTLIQWLESVLLDPVDERFLATHSRIGRVHVRIGLPQELMFTAMNRIRARVTEVLEAALADAEQRQTTLAAVNQALDLQLAIMLETYREDLAERMRAHERLATIGQLAASIGHELRNPLGIVESSLYLVRQRLSRLETQDARLDKHLDRIAEQVNVCSKTITDLLGLARSATPTKKSATASVVLERALSVAGIPDTYRVLSELPAELELFCDPDQIAQVLRNLLANAAQARPDGAARVLAEAQLGGVALFVEDDGPGIPKELAGRIFDALFTTKARGTGLGLPLARRIAEAHGGELGLVPSAAGARFRLWLPDAATESSAEASR